jgi:hypothetical protein
LYGIFNVTLAKGKTDIRLPDGPYEEVITGTVIEVKNGRVPIPRDSAILRYHSVIDLTPVYSPLMDD